MPIPNRMKRIEEEHGGLPAEEIILNALNVYKNVPDAAKELGIATQNLYGWVWRLGLEKRITWVKGSKS